MQMIHCMNTNISWSKCASLAIPGSVFPTDQVAMCGAPLAPEGECQVPWRSVESVIWVYAECVHCAVGGIQTHTFWSCHVKYTPLCLSIVTWSDNFKATRRQRKTFLAEPCLVSFLAPTPYITWQASIIGLLIQRPGLYVGGRPKLMLKFSSYLNVCLF